MHNQPNAERRDPITGRFTGFATRTCRCAWCGIQFERPDYEMRTARQFCSIAHYNRARQASPVEKFWMQVDKRPSGCWLWTGTRTTGYGVLSLGKNKSVLAHRFSWQLHHEQPIPTGMKILHTCDTPSCVNPVHLWLGTQQENIADMDRKGRRRTTCANHIWIIASLLIRINQLEHQLP